MDFAFNETQSMLLDGAERLMKARGTVEFWRARRDLPDGLDEAAWRQFAALGWLALPIAEAQGGLGGTMEDVALLMTALGAGLSTEPYVSTAVLGAPIIAESHPDALAAIAAGELRVALAHREHADRYEIATKRETIARKTTGGFILNGAKCLALDAPCAQCLIVSATLSDEPALFLIDVGTSGIVLEPYKLIDGTMAADIEITDAAIPSDCLIAQGPEAHALLETAIDRATIAALAQAVGSMEACLKICSAYLKERKQFGQPIGNFQALQHIAADMLVATHQARSILYHAIAMADEPPAARAKAVSAAKIVIGHAMQSVSRQAIQIHGGYGLTDEYAIGHHYRRLLVLEKTFGDIDFHTSRMMAHNLA